MLETMKSLLGVPALYQSLQTAVGSRKLIQTIVDELGPMSERTRVLDIGCGPADVLDKLPPVDYLGVDISSPYITAARQRYGSRGTFEVLPAEGLAALQNGPFDVILAIGLIHHLNDDQAGMMFQDITRLIAVGGRALFIDPVLVPGQNRIARWIIQQDRGQYVRDEAGYEALCRPHFSKWEASVRHDIYRIPYSHLVQKCYR